ncbi:uncharacterized protein ARMOST_10530 [Armillaria ostoyae]|uniref:Protein kinase domain-containing protein n=1 Tax=Armillaria ostoyae TaxID=47428 RepID=A0A284REJ0_ARMOS|nr:uncharacterized protein ARMOST_10530 [Armillaria ostoyae]
MAPYRTLKAMELLPPLYPDPPPGRKRMDPLISTSKKKIQFTASVDPNLLSDLLSALDEDLSRSTVLSQQYVEYCNGIKRGYARVLRNYDERYDADAYSYSETIVRRFGMTFIEQTWEAMMDLIPGCRPHNRIEIRPIRGPDSEIIPDAVIFFARHRSVLLGKSEGPLLLFPAATELVERLNSVGSVNLGCPSDVENDDNWWLILSKGALYLAEMDADIILYYSCNALVIIRRQRNGCEPDHLFVDVKANFRRGSLEEQLLRTTSRAGLERASALFPEPVGGYEPFVHLHDVYLASALVAALATTDSAEFPSLEAFRVRRRVPPLVKECGVYDVLGRERGRGMPLSVASRSRALLRATAMFNKLHGCAVEANLYWTRGNRPMLGKFLSLIPALQGQDIIVESFLQTGDSDILRVECKGKRFVLKVFPFDAFGEVEFRAYVALGELQGGVVPECYGFGYVVLDYGDRERPWILMEYIEARAVSSLSRAHRGKIMHAVKALHQLSYTHGDVLENIVWTTGEDPVVVGLGGVRTHWCRGDACVEIEDVRVRLGLMREDEELWSFVVRRKRVALRLVHVFSQPRAPADVFSFPDANETANLVDFASTDLGEKETGMLHYTPGTSRRLACVAETQSDTLAWLKDEHRTVFCIHSATCFLLFSLRLADGSLVWLFLHVHLEGKTEELLGKAELQDMLKALQPEHLFNEPVDARTGIDTSLPTDSAPPLGTTSTTKSELSDTAKGSKVLDDVLELLESLPKRNQGVGTCNVLRVIASLHTDVKLGRLDADAEHPIAELNTRFVQSITEKFSVKDILEDVVANATYLGRGYTGVKRKSIDDSGSDGPTLKRPWSASLFNNSVQEVDV